MQQFQLIVGNPIVKSGITILVAIILWRLLIAAITRFYARRFVSRFIPRVPTYATLTKSLAGAIVLFFVILELLNVWNVNVAPALWSAGALTVVVGIGAQAIVRDMLTGTFYLFEDTFDVGDGVELTTGNGVVKGAVESVGLREVRVVDDQGYVVSVPYGSVVFVANTTRLPARRAMAVAGPLRMPVGALRERIAAIAREAARSSDHEVDAPAVLLTDVTRDQASFTISFQVNRTLAHETDSRLRELIAARLQSDGLLPGGSADTTSRSPDSAAPPAAG